MRQFSQLFYSITDSFFYASQDVSSARWKNSNAFIKTIRERGTLSKEALLFSAPLKHVFQRRRACGRTATRSKAPHMSAVLESVGVLIKGPSSLRLPGSASLTRGLGHQRGSDGRRAQPRRGPGGVGEGGGGWQTDGHEGGLGSEFTRLTCVSVSDMSCFPDSLFLCPVEGATAALQRSCRICCLLPLIIAALTVSQRTSQHVRQRRLD